ncbi:ABC-F family ATP-binding cassette domain-containing protein [Jeotgalibaca sp. MA1X17-3]|uniref:ABC-F family ATP-binding cassette domain-containing protein n=1 Tax=Jeotgalibaca sp. MA1X17-3 TaxID=2908211 RepID=UPI001F3A34D0|nr:ABC-F family ATP-binding cassette domain-containing protein [Jeotgalibaca sp. MA1X17-3]UJF14797.1 ABC-F family ATP-binding cassette domain-containing protein [Jeotgalibaca sp. MA1X17-3]
MKDLKAIELTKSYGMKELFQKISFTIREGEYVGLVGKNGSGKSSLLEIIANNDKPDSGTIETSKDYRIGYLSQATELPLEDTIFETVYTGDAPIIQTVKNYEVALDRLMEDSLNPEFQDGFAEAEQKMNAENAWQADVQIKTILNKLGLTNLEQKIGELSGSQQKRVGLAMTLIQSPDLLLLDEPTNHLDMDAILWLEKYLSQYKGSLLLVTHDRYFLERVTNHMFELQDGGIETYTGNYASYLEQKAEREAIQRKMNDKQLKLYKSELEWMRKGAKARTTKQQARIHRFESLEDNVSQTSSDSQLEISLEGSRLGKRVFNLENIALSAGEKHIMNDFSHIFQSEDRIGIVGKNGSGKTTFLKMLAGEKDPDSGELIVGETVRIGYYRQIMEPFPEDKRVITYLQEVAEEAKRQDGTSASVADLLETFLFPKEMHGSLIRSLSGGEKRRLYLLKLLMTQPNVLLFDEPTNDLDIDTLTVLEDYLTTFQGAVLVVSHDRYFLDKVADKLLIIDHPGGPALFYGNMSEYVDWQVVEAKEAKQQEKNAPTKTHKPEAKKPVSQEKIKLTYKEQQEWNQLEENITLAEEKAETLKEEMLENASEYERLAELQRELDSLEEDIVHKWERYEYLSQYIEE